MKKITLYSVFKDVMKCFIAACGITLLIIFFGNQSLFFKDGELIKQAVQAVTSCIFTILLLGTAFWRMVEKWIYRKEYEGEYVIAPMPLGKAILEDKKRGKE